MEEQKREYSSKNRKPRRETKNAEIVSSKVPPHSNEAEVNVLGSMMVDRGAIAKAIEILDADCFYSDAHQKIYETIGELFEHGTPVDIITLSQELRRKGLLEYVGGTFYLTEINAQTPTSFAVEHHSRIVQEHYLKRRLIKAAGRIVEDCYDDTTDALEEIDRAEQEIFEIAEKRLRKTYSGMNKLARDTFQVIAKLADRSTDGGISGVATGFVKLDEMLGGFQKSDLIIIAARPSMGKTALALSIARNAAMEYDQPVAFFSIEMAAVQLVMRLLSAETRINAHNIRTGKLSAEQMQKIVSAIGRLERTKMYIDDSPSLSLMELRAKCRRLKAEHGVKLVIVDYLQLMHAPKAESREREISIISRTLKQIAKELDIPVVALAQLNRTVEARSDKRPMLSDLRESGSIEQDADVVMFVTRPEVYEILQYDDGTPTEGTAELIIAKQRNGPTGTVRTAYIKDYARFENLAYARFDDAEVPSFPKELPPDPF